MCKASLKALFAITELLPVRQKEFMMLYVHPNMPRKALTIPIRIPLITGERKFATGSQIFSFISLGVKRVHITAGANYIDSGTSLCY